MDTFTKERLDDLGKKFRDVADSMKWFLAPYVFSTFFAVDLARRNYKSEEGGDIWVAIALGLAVEFGWVGLSTALALSMARQDNFLKGLTTIGFIAMAVWAATAAGDFLFMAPLIALICIHVATAHMYVSRTKNTESETQHAFDIEIKKADLNIATQEKNTANARAREARLLSSDVEKPTTLPVNAKVKALLDTVDNPKNYPISMIVSGAGVSQATASNHRRRYVAAQELAQQPVTPSDPTILQ